NTLTGAFKAAVASKSPDVPRMQALLTAVKHGLDSQDFAAAEQAIAELEQLFARSTEPTSSPPEGDGLAGWTSARAQVLTNIREVVDAIRTIEHPDAIRAVVTLESIAKNITAEPKTPQSVAELKRWLEQDELVAAAERTPTALGKLSIREPLQKAL